MTSNLRNAVNNRSACVEALRVLTELTNCFQVGGHVRLTRLNTVFTKFCVLFFHSLQINLDSIYFSTFVFEPGKINPNISVNKYINMCCVSLMFVFLYLVESILYSGSAFSL